MRQAVDKKKKESKGPVLAKQPRDLPPLVLGVPEAVTPPTLEIRGYCKTTVDWINVHARLTARVSILETTLKLLWEWWVVGIRLRQRTAEWVTHTFREHHKESDLWADKGARRHVEEWVDTTGIAWPKVTGLCGFWDGSYDNGKCGGVAL